MMEFTAEAFSGVAVLVSGYSLWHTSLQRARFKLFVPPLIRYASPYQRSIFEVFEIPLTVTNEGARTGTILSFFMTVTNLESNAVKHFYSAGSGVWSLGKARGEDLQPFMPMALAGRSSQSETILFYAREDSVVEQIVENLGRYRFEMRALTSTGSKGPSLVFEMNLPHMDHRAFTSGVGSLPLHNPKWLTSAM